MAKSRPTPGGSQADETRQLIREMHEAMKDMKAARAECAAQAAEYRRLAEEMRRQLSAARDQIEALVGVYVVETVKTAIAASDEVLAERIGGLSGELDAVRQRICDYEAQLLGTKDWKDLMRVIGQEAITDLKDMIDDRVAMVNEMMGKAGTQIVAVDESGKGWRLG